MYIHYVMYVCMYEQEFQRPFMRLSCHLLCMNVCMYVCMYEYMRDHLTCFMVAFVLLRLFPPSSLKKGDTIFCNSYIKDSQMVTNTCSESSLLGNVDAHNWFSLRTKKVDTQRVIIGLPYFSYYLPKCLVYVHLLSAAFNSTFIALFPANTTTATRILATLQPPL